MRSLCVFISLSVRRSCLDVPKLKNAFHPIATSWHMNGLKSDEKVRRSHSPHVVCTVLATFVRSRSLHLEATLYPFHHSRLNISDGVQRSRGRCIFRSSFLYHAHDENSVVLKVAFSDSLMLSSLPFLVIFLLMCHVSKTQTCPKHKYTRRKRDCGEMSMTIGDVTLTEEDLQDGFSAEAIFAAPGSRGEHEPCLSPLPSPRFNIRVNVARC